VRIELRSWGAEELAREEKSWSNARKTLRDVDAEPPLTYNTLRSGAGVAQLVEQLIRNQ
jgi:hypothetical protein